MFNKEYTVRKKIYLKYILKKNKNKLYYIDVDHADTFILLHRAYYYHVAQRFKKEQIKQNSNRSDVSSDIQFIYINIQI